MGENVHRQRDLDVDDLFLVAFFGFFVGLNFIGAFFWRFFLALLFFWIFLGEFFYFPRFVMYVRFVFPSTSSVLLVFFVR